MSIYMMCLLGSTPVGSPLIGWVSDTWGPRTALLLGGVAAVTIAVVAGTWARRRGSASPARYAPDPFPTASGPRERAAHAEGDDLDPKENRP